MVLKYIAIFCLLITLLTVTSVYAQDMSPEAVSRGKYLAIAGDCTACHTVPGHAAFTGGLPLNSPMGTIYSTNITPDPAHGIGTYSLNDFDRAVRQGIAKDNIYLYPAMPYTSFAAMSDKDVADLYAYFMKGVPAAAVTPAATSLYFPFNQRWGLALWDMVFARHPAFEPQKDGTAEWNRGAYLVQTLGHCGACHTPRNIAYGEEGYTESSSAFLRGGVVDNWLASDLGGDMASGLGRWSQNDIVSFLKTGHGGDAAAFGSMTQVIEDSTQFMRDDDLKAIALYLKSLPPQHECANYAKEPVVRDNMRPGAGLYLTDCASCHQASGTGKPPKYPALAGSAAVLAAYPSSLIRLVLEGSKTARIKDGMPPVIMPAFADKLDDRELADLLTYIRNSWGNHAPAVTIRDVKVMRGELKP